MTEEERVMQAYKKIKAEDMKKNENKEKSYSKLLIVFIVLINILFAVAVLYTFLKTKAEPSALIGAWFSFTTVELWNMSQIKKKKIDKEC